MSSELIAAIPTPLEAYKLHDLLNVEGGEASLLMVGGCVRDFLYHQFHGVPNGGKYIPKDIDLATNLSEQEVLDRLSTPLAKQHGVRVQEKESVDTFGVVFVSVKGSVTYEIAPFRKDLGSKDGRRPEAVIQGSIKDDALRRDLTINNLYYDFHKGVILDFNPGGQGVSDIRDRVARFVGDPFERIEEDKLRILRFVRFFCRLNDGDITQFTDQRTLDAISQYKKLRDFKGMSAERIQMEFMAGLQQALCKSSYLHNLMRLDLFQSIFPGLIINTDKIDRFGNQTSPRVVLAVLLNGNERVSVALNENKYPNEISDPVQFLIDVQNFDPHDAVSVLKAKDRRLIKSGNRQLSKDEIAHNDYIRAEQREDAHDLCAVVGDDVPQMLKIKHLMGYHVVVPDGTALMNQGFQGREIGERQRELMQELYYSDYRSFVDRSFMEQMS